MKVEHTSVLFTLVGILSTACVVAPESRGTARRPQSVAPGAHLKQEPPPAQFERIPTPPTRDHHWASGHWRWEGERYVWVPGFYQTRPRPKVVWVDGLWTRNSQGWYWIEGQWR